MDPEFAAILEKFPATKRTLYDVPQDAPAPNALSDALRRVRESGRITAEDVRAVATDRFWQLDRWWRIDPEAFAERCGGDPFPFDRLPQQAAEDRVLDRLYDLFEGDSEKVALLLRFIVPEHYALLSQPSRFVLSLAHQPDRMTEYRSYLWRVRRLKELYEAPTVADVDTVLWTAFKRVHDPRWTRQHGQDAACYTFLRSSPPLFRVRVADILGELDVSGQELEVAEAAVDINHRLAGKLAREALETAVMQIIELCGLTVPPRCDFRDMKDALRPIVSPGWLETTHNAYGTLSQCCHRQDAGRNRNTTREDVRQAIRWCCEVRQVARSEGREQAIRLIS